MTAVPFTRISLRRFLTHRSKRPSDRNAPRGFAALAARASVLGLLLTQVAIDLPAQRWTERFTLTPRRRAGMTYDVARGRVVLFGGMTARATTYNVGTLRETWEWDGIGWTRRGMLPSEPMSADLSHGMDYDPFTRRVLVASANTSQNVTDLWTWEGRTWIRVSTTAQPTFRLHHACTFDETHRRYVMWGGSDVNGAQLDVWEYDGTNWAQIGAPGPVGRNEAAMAYDGVRGKVILFGGRAQTGGQALADTWEWDSTTQTWTQLTPVTTPPARNGHSMRWDPNRRRIVMFGGGTATPGIVRNDTWEWDGANWTEVTTATSPPARSGHASTYHPERRRLMIACGETATGLLGDTWEYDGTNWVETNKLDTPEARTDPVSTCDSTRGEIIMFGGRDGVQALLADTWRWKAAQWTRLSPAASPTARFGHAMAFDAARGNIVLFGGSATGGAQNDTWLWNGVTWTQASPSVSPTARLQHAMTYDSTRSRVVMFGGTLANNTLLADTWEWDGTTWQQVTTPTSPLARAEHSLAFDAARNQVVLFGGRINVSTYRQDTWTYNGATWTDRVTTNVTARGEASMDYDSVRGRVVLFGGKSSASAYTQNLAEWNGTNWSLPFILFTPAARASHTMAWDCVTRRMVMFGGENTAGKRSDSWVFTYNPQGKVEQIVPDPPGCAGPSGIGTVNAFGDPTLGNRSFALDLLTPNAPTLTSPSFFLLSATTATGITFGTCPLTVDPLTLFFTSYQLQRGLLATLQLPIPSTANLLGAQFIVQCMYIDPPTPLNGLAFSRGSRVTIGDY